MRYTAAYLLAVLGGNASPDVASIAKILGSVGIECDEERAQKVIDACKGRSVDDIVAKGIKKIDDISLSNASVTATSTIYNDDSDTSSLNDCDCDCNCDHGLSDLFD